MKVINISDKRIESMSGSDDAGLKGHINEGKLGDFFLDLEPDAQQNLNRLNADFNEYMESYDEIINVVQTSKSRKNSLIKDKADGEFILQGDEDDEVIHVDKGYYQEFAIDHDRVTRKLSIHIPKLIKNRKVIPEYFECITEMILDNDFAADVIRKETLAIKGGMKLTHENIMDRKELFMTLRERGIANLSNSNILNKVVFRRSIKKYLKKIEQIIDVLSELENEFSLVYDSFSQALAERGI